MDVHLLQLQQLRLQSQMYLQQQFLHLLTRVVLALVMEMQLLRPEEERQITVILGLLD